MTTNDKNKDMAELKDCPFCGGKAIADILKNQTPTKYVVKCRNECWICPETSYVLTEKESFDQWNLRIHPHTPASLDVENTSIHLRAALVALEGVPCDVSNQFASDFIKEALALINQNESGGS